MIEMGKHWVIPVILFSLLTFPNASAASNLYMGLDEGDAYHMKVMEYTDNRETPTPFLIGDLASVDEKWDSFWINVTDIRSELHDNEDEQGVIIEMISDSKYEEGYIELMDELGDWALYTNWDEWEQRLQGEISFDIFNPIRYDLDDDIYEITTNRHPNVDTGGSWQVIYDGYNSIRKENTSIFLSYNLIDGMIMGSRYTLEKTDETGSSIVYDILIVRIKRIYAETESLGSPSLLYFSMGIIFLITIIKKIK